MKDKESQILEKLHQFAKAYAEKDIEAVLDTFSRTVSPTVVVGSGSGDPLVGLESLRRRLDDEFAEWNDLQLTTRWANLQIAGDVAWISALSRAASVRLDKPLTGRFTAVLIKEEDEWRIVHLHFSFPLAENSPIGGERIAESVHASMATSAHR